MRRPERARRLLLAAGVSIAAAGCTPLDNMLASVPFFSFLREAPSFDPYEAPRPAPPNSVPFSSPTEVLLPPLEASDAALNAFAAGPHGTNPLEADSATLALGQEMFERHCRVCHGPQGHGDGTIIGPGKYPGLAPNLTLPATVARPDGYIYGIILAGRGLMPPYGPRTTHNERWAIVHYVRRLQQPAGGAAPATPATLPAGGQAADTAPPTTTTGER
ncbi:MAG: c-type cytochrome [Longimicrobiales bacterium]